MTGFDKAVGSIIMFFFSFLSYAPLANEINDYATNATLTNAVWVLMDDVFGLFWTLVIVAWLILALFFVLDEIR